MSEIKTIDEALDVLDDFLEELDECCGLSVLKYGEEAFNAVNFLHTRLADRKG